MRMCVCVSECVFRRVHNLIFSTNIAAAAAVALFFVHSPHCFSATECVPFPFCSLSAPIHLSFSRISRRPSPLSAESFANHPVDLHHPTFLQLPQIFHISSAFASIFVAAVVAFPTFGIIISFNYALKINDEVCSFVCSNF